VKNPWVKISIIICVLSFIAFLLIVIVEYQYRKDESAVGLRLSYSCLAIGIAQTLNWYYSENGRYPNENRWIDVVFKLKNLDELGCGPHENDVNFLEEGFAYNFLNKDEVTLY
jgi:hypothetical protein